MYCRGILNQVSLERFHGYREYCYSNAQNNLLEASVYRKAHNKCLKNKVKIGVFDCL